MTYNKRNNNWQLILFAAILALAMFAVFLCTGCAAGEAAEPAPKPEPRFTFKEVENNVVGLRNWIITDNDTGVQYLYLDGGYDGGMVKLEPLPDTDVGNTETKHPYDENAKYIAKTIYGEARGCSKTEQAAVAWCILNRVDSDDPYYPDDIVSVITQEDQFDGYDPEHPVLQEHYELALDVIDLWLQEDGKGIVAGRVLPKEYLWFKGDGECNVFRNAYEGECDIWDWSLASPYEEG